MGPVGRLSPAEPLAEVRNSVRELPGGCLPAIETGMPALEDPVLPRLSADGPSGDSRDIVNSRYDGLWSGCSGRG